MAIGASAVVKRAEKNKRPFVSGADGGGFCWEHKRSPASCQPARKLASRIEVCDARFSDYVAVIRRQVLYCTIPHRTSIDGHRHGPRTTLYPM